MTPDPNQLARAGAAERPLRPLLRYHGGKWELAPWIVSNLPPHRVYVEPYGGAASVLLNKPRSYGEIYNDLADDIVNLFRVLRDEPHRLEAVVWATPFSRAEYVGAFTTPADPVEWARRVLIRSHMGYAGAATHGNVSGFRANSLRSGSHPATQWCNFPGHINAIVERFRGVVIEHRPALEVITANDSPETLFYLDPPYVFATRDAGTDYHHELSDSDHAALADAARSLSGMAVVSGYHSALYDTLFGGWQKMERAALAEGARERVEVLWFNDAAWDALQACAAPSLFDKSEVAA